MSARLRTALQGASVGRTVLLTNWVSVSGSSPVTTATQDESEWAELSDYADATFFIEVAQVSNPSGGLLLLYLESAPTRDESLFTASPIVGPIPITASTTPYVAKSASVGAVPLGRFVRWRVVATTSAAWSATFRVRIACSHATYFAPTQLGNCAFWVRADRGLTFTGATVTGWADQSGLDDPNRNLVAGSDPPRMNVSDGSYHGQATLTFTGGANSYFTNSGTWNPTLTEPRTWVLVGHRTSTAATHYFMDGNSAGAADYAYVSNTGVITVGSGASISSGTGNYWNAPSMLLYESNGASSAAYLNSMTATLVAGNAGSGNPYSMTMGAHAIYWGGGNNWPGTIAEVIEFNGLLTSAQKQMLKLYLVNRYALSIT